MRFKSLIIIWIVLLALLIPKHIYAYTEENIIKQNDIYTKSVNSKISEEKEVIELLDHNIIIENIEYKLNEIVINENDILTKDVVKEKKEILTTDNQSYIEKYFGKVFEYEDNDYKGEIPITHININRIDNGQYQELREKIIEFSKFSSNDLNNIKKEIKENGQTYYLINVDWEYDETEDVDNNVVPINYKGKMKYQTIVTLNNPYTYEVTVTYSGKVENKEKEYKYTGVYKKIEPVAIIEKTDDSKNVKKIIISGIGLGLIVFIVLLNSKNVKIYNRSENGYNLLGSFKIDSKRKNIIDITKYNHKISSNVYSIKFKKSIYKKIKDKTIFVKIKDISKPITVNSEFIEFLI